MELLDLPDSILLQILTFLNPEDVTRCGGTCTKLGRIAHDDILWQKLFHAYFHIPQNFPLRPGHQNWRAEFIRLVDEVPMLETQVIDEHTDEIWYVSFSHDGHRFVTCSKDGGVQVWNSRGHPVTREFQCEKKTLGWKWSWYPEFNSNDSLLLVSGIREATSEGEIVIFDLEDDFRPICRVPNLSYDACFGLWVTQNSFLSSYCDQDFNGQSCQLILNQLSDQKGGPPKQRNVFNFFSPGWSRAGRTLIGRCFENLTLEKISDSSSPSSVEDQHAMIDTEDFEHEKKLSDIFYSKKYLQNFNQNRQNTLANPSESSSSPLTGDADDGDRWLIFPFGSKTYLQHEVCFKKINLSQMAAVLNSPQENDEEPPVENQFDEVDKTLEFNGEVVGLALSVDNQFLYVHCRHWPTGYEPPNPGEPTPISHGSDIHVIHMPTLTQVGMTHRVHSGHFTDLEAKLYIYVGASRSLLGTGSNGYRGPVRDQNAHLWDQHYGLHLLKLPHEGHASCVAFQPIVANHSKRDGDDGNHDDDQDSEMMVSVSHDKRIRIWRSRHQCRQLKFDLTTLKEATKMFPQNSIVEKK